MRPLKNVCEVAVIGGGIAGLTAAHHAARLGRLVTLFEPTGLYGGQVATIDEVDGLGVPGKLSGQDVAIHLLEEARKIGVQVIERGVDKLDLGKKIALTDETGHTHNPDAVIVASGASLKKLGVSGEKEFKGRGVSHCATCDGGFFRGQDVVVVGGGDAAVQEALLLARTSRKVFMVTHSPMKARRDYVDKISARENVEFVWDSEVSEILGDQAGVSGVRVRNVRDGSAAEIACLGVFPYIGVKPNTDFLPASMLTPSGHVKAGADGATADARVFAVGAVRSGYGGAIVQAMAEGVGVAEALSRALVH